MSYAELISVAIRRGWVQPAAPTAPTRYKLTEAQRESHRKASLARYYAKRDANVAAGLTTDGHPRVRARVSRAGLTPEQRMELKRRQKRASYARCEGRGAA